MKEIRTMILGAEISQRANIRDAIEQDIQEFLNSGGEIEHLGYGLRSDAEIARFDWNLGLGND